MHHDYSLAVGPWSWHPWWLQPLLVLLWLLAMPSVVSLPLAWLLVVVTFKKTTGSCFPFLGDKQDDVTPTPITAVPAA